MLHSVIIGIDRYEDPQIVPLACARKDALAMAELLGRIESAERATTLLLDEQATKTNISLAIAERLPQVVDADDIVLIYFAGHGSPETDGSPDDTTRFIVPFDAKVQYLYTTAINLETDLEGWFARLSARWIVVVLDACFSGAAGGRTFEGPRLARAGYRSSVSLAPLDLGEGRITLSACGDDELARERPELGHGVFTLALLEALGRPRGQPTVGIGTLYEEIGEAVSAGTKGKQKPVIHGKYALLRLPALPAGADSPDGGRRPAAARR